jgi:hypothetical protein
MTKRATKALQILESNHCMINSLCTKEELKSYKDFDFVEYLKRAVKSYGNDNVEVIRR